jgi:crotonobetainyl-CoA:carnitine CoA-transferase CaiB-like acyl-CoA transferase
VGGVGRVSGADGERPLPLGDVRVVDLSTVIAGPSVARYLADFGADVIKVERPEGDTLRNIAWRDPRDGTGLWWKMANRNKRLIVLDLKDDGDRDLLLHLVDEADVLVENFRPGTLERLGLGPSVLHARNERLVVTRVTGFGQQGPYAGRPGFASIAEAMSGYAAIAGDPDGPPLLPPIALTDEVTGLVGAFATLVAIHSRVGQVVDVNLMESLFQLMGPLMSLYLLTGEQQPRLGAGIPYSVPRGTYRCADGEWVAVSTSSDSVAARVMRLLGVGDDPRFTTFAGRVEHREELDELVAAWVGARPMPVVVAEFTAAEAAIAPVMDMAAISGDPHVVASGMISELEGTPMQGLVARLSATPGRLRWAGRPIDADGEAIRRDGWGAADAAEPG